MTASSNLTEQQLVFLDPFLLDRGRINLGLSLKELAKAADIDYRTVRDIYREGGVLPSKALDLAKQLGCKVVDLLAPRDPRYLAQSPNGPNHGLAEWETDRFLEQGRLAPNGLYYIVSCMHHRHTTGRRGRGKYYHLGWMRSGALEEMQHKLSRHSEVCCRVKSHRHVAMNLTSVPNTAKDGWWVVDEWTGEKTLADMVQTGPFPAERVPALLHDIATGLAALHQADVIMRELAPSRVLLSDDDGHAVLTDFELAKLLDGVPSVSEDWPEDPFRAPELDGAPATVSSDLFSLGRLAATIITGIVPGLGQESTIFAESKMPKRLQKLMTQCVASFPKDRLSELPLLHKELARWAEK
ncbi:MAG: protein kinase [Planctomycetaceae bacterium]|nr:protein kinase [Planctomycetaceae bacterium]